MGQRAEPLPAAPAGGGPKVVYLRDGVHIDLPAAPVPRSAATYDKVVYVAAAVAAVVAVVAAGGLSVARVIGWETAALAAVGVPVITLVLGLKARSFAFNLWVGQKDGSSIVVTGGQLTVVDRRQRWAWSLGDVSRVTVEYAFATILFVRAWRIDVHFHDVAPHPILFGYPAGDLEEVAVALNQVLKSYRGS